MTEQTVQTATPEVVEQSHPKARPRAIPIILVAVLVVAGLIVWRLSSLVRQFPITLLP